MYILRQRRRNPVRVDRMIIHTLPVPRKIWCESLSAKRTILSSIDGQYRGLPHQCDPHTSLIGPRFLSIISWVLRICMRNSARNLRCNSGCRQKGKQRWVIIGFLTLQVRPIDRTLPSNRGGVPVFKRPNGRLKLSSRSANLTEGRSPIRPPGTRYITNVNYTAQECA